MKTPKSWLVVCLSLLAGIMLSTTGWSATVAELEKRIQKLEKKLDRTRSRVKAGEARMDKTESRLKINGFATAGAAYIKERGVTYIGLDDDVSTSADSVLGAQMQFRVDDTTDFVVQMVGEGSDNFDVRDEWAFISKDLSQKWTVRAGRLRLPYYLTSENLDVGLSYPWVRPPEEVYGPVPLTAYNGADVLYKFGMGGVNGTVQIFAGSTEDEFPELGIAVKNNAGINLTASWNNFTFRAGTARGNVFLDPKSESYTGLDTILSTVKSLAPTSVATISEKLPASFSGVGMIYDNGKLLVMTEATSLEWEKGIFEDPLSSYVTVGYRFGKVMPYASYARFDTQAKGDERRELAAFLTEQVASSLDGVATLATAAHTDYVTNVVNGAQNPATWQGSSAAYATFASAAASAGLLSAFGFSSQADLDQAVQAGIVGSTELYGIATGIADNASGMRDGADAIRDLSNRNRSQSIGVRYDITPRVALKLEAMEVFGLVRDPSDGSVQTGTGMGFPTGWNDTSFNVYSFAINAAF